MKTKYKHKVISFAFLVALSLSTPGFSEQTYKVYLVNNSLQSNIFALKDINGKEVAFCNMGSGLYGVFDIPKSILQTIKTATFSSSVTCDVSQLANQGGTVTVIRVNHGRDVGTWACSYSSNQATPQGGQLAQSNQCVKQW